MLIVTVELAPRGDLTKRKVLGVAYIANDASGTLDTGNYNYRLSKYNPIDAWRQGRVEGFPRQKLGHWDLLFRCLRDAVSSRNKP